MSTITPSEGQNSNAKRVKVNKEAVQAMVDKLVKALQEGAAANIKNGLFHADAKEHDALWVATDLIQKSQKFPNYKLTFYHKGMGEGTNTCAVTFIDNSSEPADPT